jgi:hypothetical protein
MSCTDNFCNFLEDRLSSCSLRSSMALRGRILGHNWDRSLKSFPPCYSQSPLPTDFTLPQSGLKLICNVNKVIANLKSENSKDFAQKPQRDYTFMNLALGHDNDTCTYCSLFNVYLFQTGIQHNESHHSGTGREQQS